MGNVPEDMQDLIVVEVSMLVQLFGGIWLYTQIAGTELNLSIFGYIAGLWTLVAVFVMLRDIFVFYTFINREDLINKLCLMEGWSKKRKNLFVLSFPGFALLCIPGGLYRAKKGL